MSHPEQNRAIESLAECPLDEIEHWATEQAHILNLTFLEACKVQSDGALRSDPDRVDRLTARMLWLAQNRMQNAPLAEPLAAWARGNWACFHAPHKALPFYQTALYGYNNPDTPVEMARILSNTVAVAIMCASFQEGLDAYEQAAPILENLTGEDRRFLLSLKQNYGTLLHYLGFYEEALGACMDAKALALKLDHMDEWSEIQVNQAYTLAMQGELNRCEGLLLESRRIADAYKHPVTVARIDLNLGILYTAQGRPADALRVFQRARTRFAELNISMEEGSVLLYQARLLERMGALREARQDYAQAGAYFEEVEMTFQVGIAWTHGARAYRKYGEYGQAERLIQQATTIWETLELEQWQVQTLLEQVALALARQQSDEALSLLDQCQPNAFSPAIRAEYHALLADAQSQRWQETQASAHYRAAYDAYTNLLAYSREHSERLLERHALAGLGKLMQQDRSQAVGYLEAAAEKDEEIRQHLSVQELKASFQFQNRELLPLLAKIAIEDGEPVQALRYIWQAKGSSLLELLQSTTDADQPIAIQQTRQALAGHRWQLLREEASDMPDALLERHHQGIRELEEQLYELRREQNQAATTANTIRWTEPDPLLQTIAADVLIEYICFEEQIFAVRVDCSPAGQNRYTAFHLTDIDTVLDLADELTLVMQSLLGLTQEQRSQSLAQQLAECQPLLGELYDCLIRPLGELPVDATLLIAPDDLLHTLPFAAFWDGQHYLTQRHLLKHTPTAALALHPVTPTSTQPALVIGASSDGRLTTLQR